MLGGAVLLLVLVQKLLFEFERALLQLILLLLLLDKVSYKSIFLFERVLLAQVVMALVVNQFLHGLTDGAPAFHQIFKILRPFGLLLLLLILTQLRVETAADHALASLS